MNKTFDEALQNRLSDYCAEYESQRKAAHCIGISAATVNRYINGSYVGDLAKVEDTLRAHFAILDAQREQQAQSAPLRMDTHYVPTSISENIYKVIRYCQLERGIMIIHGDAGIGKTRAAAKYVGDNPTSAIYLEVTPTTGTLSRFIKLLARELRIPATRDQMALIDEIKGKLLGTNKVLIIDEAQHLKYLTLEEIRNWTTPHPITGQSGVGIVLIGNSLVHSRMVGRQEAQFAQQFNRSRPHQYTTLQIQQEDIIKMFPILGEKGMEKEIRFLHSIATSKWAMRSAVIIWNDAVNAEDVSYRNLQALAQRMGIGVF